MRSWCTSGIRGAIGSSRTWESTQGRLGRAPTARCGGAGESADSSGKAASVGDGTRAVRRVARELRERSLAVLHPHLLTDWHAQRNGNLDPYRVPASSERRAWWCCQTCGHEWASVIKQRTLRGEGCPECGRRTSPEFSGPATRWRRPREESLGVLHPELLPEWHAARNGGLDPFAVGTGSNLRVWWRCRVRIRVARSAIQPLQRLRLPPMLQSTYTTGAIVSGRSPRAPRRLAPGSQPRS